MTRSSFKLRNVVKNSIQPRRLNLRKVAAIVACLAVTAIFSGCDKDDEKGDYTIKYSPGTHSSGDNYSQAKTAGKDVTLRDVTYTRVGYKQTGWSKKENGSSKDYSLKDTYTDDADIELFPFWKEGDDDDDDEEYNLPTNVKFTRETEGWGTIIYHTHIKIGENYYWKRVFFSTDAGKNLVAEFYLKQNNNGTWTKYGKSYIEGDNPNWSLYTDRPYSASEKIGEVNSEFLSFMEIWASHIIGATKGGKQTIAGVSTDIYTTSNGTVLNYDPVTKLVFKVTSSDSRSEVTSWDTSVTSFGGIALP